MSNISIKPGKLTIFTSYTPGAGKSYLMLSKAMERAGVGESICFGFLNGNHRNICSLLENNILGEDIPKRYSLFSLLSKNPQLVVMDEMGMHGVNMDQETFVYQDIEKLLDAGIDVYTTVNIKRFTQANPLFKKVTGIGIKKTVPDKFLEMADCIYFIDREPEMMIKDFKEKQLFYKKYRDSKIMKKNFEINTLRCYRDISLKYLNKYEDKVRVVKR